MNKITILVIEKWSVESVTKDSSTLYLFGDNNVGRGKGGQAIIRGLPNAIGIPTKKNPGYKSEHYYTDLELKENIEKISSAIKKVQEKIVNDGYKCVALPKNGFGTGLANLLVKAPKTYEQLNKLLFKFVEEISPGSSKKVPYLAQFNKQKC